MRHNGIGLFLFVVAILIMVVTYMCVPSHAQGGANVNASASPTLLLMQSGTLQRASATPTPDARGRECMRRTADWERNRTAWGIFLGFIIFLAFLYLLTFLRFKNSTARWIVALVVAAFLGPAIMAVVAQDALKVCIEPPGFFGSLTAPLFGWTFAGSISTLCVITLLRWLVVRRRFSQELPTA